RPTLISDSESKLFADELLYPVTPRQAQPQRTLLPLALQLKIEKRAALAFEFHPLGGVLQSHGLRQPKLVPALQLVPLFHRAEQSNRMLLVMLALLRADRFHVARERRVGGKRA